MRDRDVVVWSRLLGNMTVSAAIATGRPGPSGSISSPSTARPRAVAMTGAPGNRPSIWSRPSHDEQAGARPGSGPDKANELSAIPELLARLGEDGGLEGALVSIDAIATNATIASAIRATGADYLLAVKANQPTLRAEVEAAFQEAPKASLRTFAETDKGHGRIEERRVSVLADVDWLSGERRFPGELRLPDAACLIRVESRTQLVDRSRKDVRYFISSTRLDAEKAASAVRGHWGIENRLHWVLDVLFKDDQSRLRKGHGARNMAVVRHFALNLIRSATDKKSLKSRRKLAGWSPDYLAKLLDPTA